ncbi:MAG: sugar transferase, partial [Candidatus Binatia bacterium]
MSFVFGVPVVAGAPIVIAAGSGGAEGSVWGIMSVAIALVAMVLVAPRMRGSLRALLRRRAPERVVILGAGAPARKIAAAVEAAPEALSLVGFVSVEDDVDRKLTPIGLPLPAPILGRMVDVRSILESVHPDRVIVALTEWRNRLPVNELLECGTNGTAVETASQAYERLTGKLAIESLTPSYLLFSGPFRTKRSQELLTRAVSLVLAVVGLAITAPLMAIVAALIKLDSPGPALFVQERVGLRGRRFKLLKFRTMLPAEGTTSEWVCDNTDRITRVGEWVRKFRLDELPQFINVLRGDMNLVGPRPHPVTNRELFSSSIPFYSLRDSVRPGITGWAQVRNGYANNLDEETEKMRYDLYYIKNRSLWLDIRILLETVKVVLFGQE